MSQMCVRHAANGPWKAALDALWRGLRLPANRPFARIKPDEKLAIPEVEEHRPPAGWRALVAFDLHQLAGCSGRTSRRQRLLRSAPEIYVRHLVHAGHGAVRGARFF